MKYFKCSRPSYGISGLNRGEGGTRASNEISGRNNGFEIFSQISKRII